MNQLLAYNKNINSLYFTTRFIDGLRLDVRATVLIQRPPDLESVVALAYLQEEVDEMMPRKEIRKTEPAAARPSPRGEPPHPLPMPSTPRPVPIAATEDKRGTE